MILKNKYPICEFDTSKDPLIQPANFLAETLPEKCVITFFRRFFLMFGYNARFSFAGTLIFQQNLNHWQRRNIQS